jgi:hypothetical protein
MPKPIVCLSEQLRQYLELFRSCFSKRQWKYYVIVLLGLIECEERKTMTGLLRVVAERVCLLGLSRFLNKYPWGQNATAWKDLSLFSANQMGAGKMYFVRTLTQRARCGEGCNQGNNYPDEGYRLLYYALASNPTTAMSLRWSTDITIQPTSTP